MIVAGFKWARHVLKDRADERYLRASLDTIDAVLASFPKSGRTWLRFLLSCYFDRAAELGINPDLSNTFQVLPNMDRDMVRGLPAFRHAGKVPLIAVSHRPYSPIFRGLPVLFLVRDPRDVMVSAYFHATRQKRRFSGALKVFLRDHDQGLTAFLGYLNGWATGLAEHRYLLLSYEDMSGDAGAVIRKILRFLDLPCDEAVLAHAIAASSFPVMRRLEEKVGIPGHIYDRTDEESLRMRRGKVGGYGDYLDHEDLVYIAMRSQEALIPAAHGLLGPTGFDCRPRRCCESGLPGRPQHDAKCAIRLS